MTNRDAASPCEPLSGAVRSFALRMLRGCAEGVVAIGRLADGVECVDVVAGRRAPHADGDTLFEIGSVTKTMTASVLAEMAARGEVRLDDAIDMLLPAGVAAPAYDERRITLADLAEQRSGLPRLPSNLGIRDVLAGDPYRSYDDTKLAAFLRTFRLRERPGARFSYSNLGFGLLGMLLARRAGTSYSALLKERLFEPLGMSHTHADATADDRLLPGHNPYWRVPHWHFDALAGAGAVRSTVRDLLRYAWAALRPVNAAGRAIHEASLPRAPIDGGRIGLGWITSGRSGIVWHNGGTGGFRSYLGLLPDERRAVVVLANVAVDVDRLAIHLLLPSIPLGI